MTEDIETKKRRFAMQPLKQRLIISLMVSLWLVTTAFVTTALAQTSEKGKYGNEELDQMLAPIALYPDSLLAQMMMAATYPIEIVQADRFVKSNKDIKGAKLLAAAKDKDWDPTVKSLLQLPDVLAMMSDKLDWTTKLGDAFLAQKVDVMDSIQRLRKKAHDTGNLKTTKEQVVKVEKETIIIQPSNPQVIYVPTYNPTVVYGVWTYPAYPPYPYYPPGYGAAAATFGFIAGVAVGASGCCWGGWNWGNYDIDIDINHNYNFNKDNYNKETAQKYQQQIQSKRQQDGKSTWQHNPEHRKGVAYKDTGTAQHFGQSTDRTPRARPEGRGISSGEVQRGAGRENAFSGMGNGNRERMASERGWSSRSRDFSKGGFGGAGFGGGRGGRR